jgi:hypothetical protein
MLKRILSPAGGALAAIALATAIVLTVDAAEAKSSYDSAYGYDRTWNAAVRMVRVDLGFKVTEKDDASGYLLFDYKSHEGGSKTTPGSIEIVRGKEPEDPVRVVVQLPQMPRYHEQAIVDGLASKMLKEYGDPPSRRKKPAQLPPAPIADAGSE